MAAAARGAYAEGAAEEQVLGFFFCGKTASSHMVNELGTQGRFDILNVNKFNSTRKRMSVACRTPEGGVELYCKGADNVMLERVQCGGAERERLESALKAYAQEGLRTLVIAKKKLAEEEWEAWDRRHKAAATALVDREEALMDVRVRVVLLCGVFVLGLCVGYLWCVWDCVCMPV